MNTIEKKVSMEKPQPHLPRTQSRRQPSVGLLREKALQDFNEDVKSSTCVSLSGKQGSRLRQNHFMAKLHRDSDPPMPRPGDAAGKSFLRRTRD